MNEAPQPEGPKMETVKHEIREEHGEAAEATSSAPQEKEQASSEEFEQDPARNPSDEALKNIKGA